MLRVEEVFGAARMQIAGDNQNMLHILKTGRRPTLRHLARAHRVSVAWLHEQHARENLELTYVSTDGVAEGIFKKSIHVLAKRTEARKNISSFGSMDELHDTIRRSQQLPNAGAVACVCSRHFPSSQTSTQGGVDPTVL